MISYKDFGILVQIIIFFLLYMVLKWQLVNTPSFIMLPCVYVFKTSVLHLAPRSPTFMMT